MEKIRFIDLFCGLGGFRIGFENAAKSLGLEAECVFSSDIDAPCQLQYEANFGDIPTGDITKVAAADVPDHDVLLGGFPCQAFSIAGKMRGFEDTRGTLFFDVARILDEKKPRAFILENVKQLVGHDEGRTLKTIMATLADLGYQAQYSVLNALDYGLPQKRERIFIVGHREPIRFEYPQPQKPFKPLSEILEKRIPQSFLASERIREKRHAAHKSAFSPSIWHENKSGNICSYPFSCALRAGASYNYLLVDGERRLTPREMFRLQGFPDSYKIIVNDSQARKQAGNSIPVNVVEAVSKKLLPFVAKTLAPELVLENYKVNF